MSPLQRILLSTNRQNGLNLNVKRSASRGLCQGAESNRREHGAVVPASPEFVKGPLDRPLGYQGWPVSKRLTRRVAEADLRT
jgi:hypothetical protein